MKTKNYFLTFLIVFSSVVSTYFVTVSTAQQALPPILKTADNEYLIAAVLYQQRAAEYRALAFQAFNTAKMRLDEDSRDLKNLPKAEREKTRAVIVDIDETILDNSPHQAFLVKNQLLYNSTTWSEWVKLQKAKAVPGAVEFLQYAANPENKVKVFYVSNRDNALKQETTKNLTDLKFPDVTEETLMLQTDKTTSTKQPRRDAIEKDYRIVLLIGDNLDDFTADYEGKKSVEQRFSAAEKDKNLFGKKYIVLPNAMYGTWERATYNYDNNLIDCEKIKIQTDQLESYR